MNIRVILCCTLLFYFGENVILACHQDTYVNICGDDGGDNNTTETEELEIICDCSNVIFCTVFNYTQECSSAVVQLSINKNVTFTTPIHCEISPMDPQVAVPTLEVLNSTEYEILVKFSVVSHFEMYRIICTGTEFSYDYNETFSSEWKILGVTPQEVFADSEVKLNLKLDRIKDQSIYSTPAWCFINTPENITEILSAVMKSEDEMTCSEFIPAVPGVFTISLSSGLLPYNSESGVYVKVTAKRPVAQHAGYENNFLTIIIQFDTNIELLSNCGNTLPETLQRYFGTSVKCYARGNTLQIKMAEQFEIINNITINSENQICREGSLRSGLCLSALPVDLIVSKPQVLGPGLSFYISNACENNKTQKYMRVTMMKSNRQNFTSNQIFQPHSNGKNQRRNLITWRGMREAQTKFSPRLVLQVNKTSMVPFVENLSAFENVLDVDDSNLGSGASVSVNVQSSPASLSLLAEAHVSFCNDCGTLFRYKWIVNGRNMSEDGKLLVLRNLPPEKYLIKCVVVRYNSSEILGQGWATAEILKNSERIIIVPSELAVGTSDGISLQAVTLHGNSVTWTCRTAGGEPCVTTDQKLLSEVYNFSTHSISLPAGTLAVGNYVLTALSSNETETAKVFIQSGDTTVNVDIPSIFVNPSLDIVLVGNLLKMKGVCRAGWSAVRQKGFSYINLRTVGVEEISIGESPNWKAPLKIPSSTLQSDSLYLLRLRLLCPQSGSLRYVKLPLRTIDPPVVSPITVQPLEGKAMITKFEVAGAEAEVSLQDYPLVFEWSYIDPCDIEISLEKGISAKNFTTYLPPGDLKIMARVCNGKEICSTSISSTITVVQSDEIPKENFDKTLDQMQYLMLSGDVSEAFGLASIMFKSLTMTAEFEIREKLLSTVEEVIGLRIKDLTEKLSSDTIAVKSALQFCESAQRVIKYFRKGSAILQLLRNFRDTLKNYPNSN